MAASKGLPLLRPSATLDHLVRYLSTWSGSDKAFMTFQYSSKLLCWALLLRGRKSRLAGGLSKLSDKVSDARILWRFFGLFQTFQWLASLENPMFKAPSAASHLLQRLQALTLIAYYPLEHLYYLGAHAVLPISAARLTRISLWSCRFWAGYVVLEFLHLAEQARLCREAEEEIQRGANDKQAKAETLAIADTRANIRSNLIINSAYFPLTLQWSLPQGLYTNDVWTGLFGTIAALQQWQLGWKATSA